MGDHNVSTSHADGQIPESHGDGLSYVYVVGFASGTIKVGKADDPRKRLTHHGRHAEIHGDRIERHWVSTPHADPYRNEGRLIDFCESNGKVISGREYFRGVAFDQVVQFAETLSYPLTNPASKPSGGPDILPAVKRLFQQGTWEVNCLVDLGVSHGEMMAAWEAAEAEPATWAELKELARRRRERARLKTSQDERWIQECRERLNLEGVGSPRQLESW